MFPTKQTSSVVISIRASHTSPPTKNMKQAIKNLINAYADKIRPCKHDWEKLNEAECNIKVNPSYTWNEYVYRCKKCCASKKITTE